MFKIKHIEVVAYDSKWVSEFDNEAQLIKLALGVNCIDIFYIGSTSVPGLAAKPIIDIIAVVHEGIKSISPLESVGYIYKGEWNIPMKWGFAKRSVYKFNLHVFEQGHPEIEWNLLFRDYLRNNPDAKDEYQRLKYALLSDQTSYNRSDSHFPNYTLRKGCYIREILKRAGFNRLKIIKCTDETEWQAVKEIKNQYIVSTSGIERAESIFHHDLHTHLALYEGTIVIGYAHVQFLNDETSEQNRSALLRTIVIEEMKRGQRAGTWFLRTIEKWLKKLDVKCVYVELALKSLDFYLKNHYAVMPFISGTDGVQSDCDGVKIGKLL